MLGLCGRAEGRKEPTESNAKRDYFIWFYDTDSHDNVAVQLVSIP